MEQRIAIGAGEIWHLEIECPHCQCPTAVAVEAPKWEYPGEPKTPLGERGINLCAWCGRGWPDRYGAAVSQLREALQALRARDLPPLRLVAK